MSSYDHKGSQDKRTAELRSDPRSIKELIPLAMEEVEEEDPYKPFDALAVLQARGNAEVFEAARKLCESPDPKERSLGATILSQHVVRDKNFPEEKFDILFGLLDNDTDPEVIASVCFALGYPNDPRSIEHVARFKNHPDEYVRRAVVHGLSGYEDDLAIRTLIELSADEDEDVRNWATFGLGSQIEEVDTLEIREALTARLDDDFEEVRLEAMYGLAIRKDRRALDLLKEELEVRHYYSDTSVFEAAAALADPSLLPGLLKLRKAGEEDEFLEEAIKACGGKALHGEQ